MKKSIAIVGAGGMAREVEWIIRCINEADDSVQYSFVGYLISDVSKRGRYDSVDQTLGDFSWLATHHIDALAMGIADAQAKRRLTAELLRHYPTVEWPAVVHPSATYDKDTNRFERGVVIHAGMVATVNVVVEEFAMVNTSCTLGHEARIGRWAVINPGANVGGGVVIEDAVLVGSGAQILQYKTIGADAIIGAGAVVTDDVPPGETVIGVPAKPLRKSR